MMGPVGLKGSGAAAALARQRMAAMSRSSRSMSTFRSQSLRFPSQRGQLKSALSGSAPWRTAPAVTGPAGIRFNSTSSDPFPEVTLGDETKTLVDIHDITTIPERIGYLKELGLDFGYGFTSTMQYLIEHIHIYTGLPWWASIVTVGILTRVAMLHPVIGASENAAKMTNAKSKIDPLRERMLKAGQAGNQQETQLARAQLKEIHQAHGIKTWKSFFPMLQIPLGFGCFRVVRAMTALPVPALAMESAGWIKDLTIPDTTYILPMIAAATLCLSLRKGGESGAMPMMQTEAGKYIVYGFPVMSFAFMAFMPSALQLYFVATGIFGLGQTYLINSDGFRKWMNLSIAQKATARKHKFSELTQNTQSKGLRLLLERIEQDKAAQQKAREEARVQAPQKSGSKASGKVSFIDRVYQKFGKAGTSLSDSMSKALNTPTVEQRIAKDNKKQADEYEAQRRDEDELLRKQRNEARRKEHLQTLANERNKASESLKNSQAALRKVGGARGPRRD